MSQQYRLPGSSMRQLEGVGHVVWFENNPRNSFVGGILRRIEDMQNVGLVTKKVGMDSVWFDTRSFPSNGRSQGGNSLLVMDPLHLNVKGNGLSPRELEKEKHMQTGRNTQKSKWTKSIESNEKIVIRI